MTIQSIMGKKAASYVSIRPSPSISLPSIKNSFGHPNHAILTEIESDLVLSPEVLVASKQPLTLPGGEEGAGSSEEVLSSKQQKAYEELKISIVLCGEYLSNISFAKSKCMNQNSALEEGIRSSLQSSLDTNMLTSISSKRKKDIILTATKCIQWFEKANMDLKLLLSQMYPNPAPNSRLPQGKRMIQRSTYIGNRPKLNKKPALHNEDFERPFPNHHNENSSENSTMCSLIDMDMLFSEDVIY